MLVRAIGTPFRWRRRDHRKRFLNATEKEAARVALEQRDAQKAENKRDPPRSAVIEGDQFRSPRGAKAEEAIGHSAERRTASLHRRRRVTGGEQAQAQGEAARAGEG